MNETKKLKFPVASIFTALLALGLIDNLRYLLLRAGTLDRMIGYRMVVEFDSTHSVPHILYQMLLIGSMVLLTVLLEGSAPVSCDLYLREARLTGVTAGSFPTVLILTFAGVATLALTGAVVFLFLRHRRRAR